MKIPVVTEFKSTKEFVQALIDINRDSTIFSHRFLAKKLKFPPALLSDVTKGRRKLTLARAVQMAERLELDAIDTEYIINLTLQDKSSGAVRKHFESLTRQRYRPSSTMTTNDPEERYSKIEILAIQKMAVGLIARNAATDLKKSMVTFPDLTCDEINWFLKTLEREGSLSIGSDGRYRSNKKIWVQRDNIKQGVDPVHRQYAHNFLRYYELQLGPATLNSGFIRIPNDHFDKVRERVTVFREFLWSLNHEFDENDRRSHQVFQFDLSLYPLHPKILPESDRSSVRLSNK